MIWLLLPVALAALVLGATRYLGPPKAPIKWQGNASRTTAGSLTITTWNIGFAGQGAGAEMMFDGGKHLRPQDRQTTKACAVDIAETINGLGADITLLQEDALGGFMNRGVPLDQIIRTANSDQAHVFWPDMRTWFVPGQMGLRHGLTTLSKLAPQGPAEIVRLPQDPIYFYGVIKKHYGGVAMRLPSGRAGQDIVVINIHLSAFDEGAQTRQQQLQSLLGHARQEIADGHAVIIGGDWNMTLSDKTFPHNSEMPEPHSAFRMTQNMLPDGWKLIIDESVPTNRSVARPYVPGATRTTILDGFVVSPNVQVHWVETKDLGFRSSDHQPVTGRFEIT